MTDKPITDISTLIDRFGGVRPMARKLDVPVSTIQGWKKRDTIPADRIESVRNAAKRHEVSLAGYDINEANPHDMDGDLDALQRDELQDVTKDTGTKERSLHMGDRAPKTNHLPVDEREPLEEEIERRDFESAIRPPRSEKAQFIIDGTGDNKSSQQTLIVILCIFALTLLIGFFLLWGGADPVEPVEAPTQMAESGNELNNNGFSFLNQDINGKIQAIGNNVSDLASAVGVNRDQEGNISFNQGMSLSDRVTALENRLSANGQDIDLSELMTRFQTIGENANGNTDTAISDLKGIITIIQGRMDQIDAALVQAKSENEDIAQALENVTGRDVSAAAMLLALTQFRTSMNREDPFVDDLQLLQELVGEDDPQLTAAINRLAPYAQNGVLSPEGLSKELRSIAGDIVAAKLRGEDVSVQDRVLTRLGQIVSVEKNGKPVIATREQEIIAAAQKSLDDGNVEQAMRQLQQLEGESAQAAQPFMEQLKGTVLAEQTSDMMMQKLLKLMQEPQSMQNLIQKGTDQIQNMTQGEVHQDPASGIIILE